MTTPDSLGLIEPPTQKKASRAKSLALAPVLGWLETVIPSFGFGGPPEALKRLESGKYGSRQEQVTGEFKKAFGVEDNPEENLLRKFGAVAGIPLPGMGAGEQAIRSGVSALLSQTAEEANAGPLLQAIASLPAWMTPAGSARLMPNKEMAPLVEKAREMGLNEKQITRSIQGKRKAGRLGSIASKGIPTEEAIKDTQSALGTVIKNIRSQEGANIPMSRNAANELVSGFQKDLMELPASERALISPDFDDFMNSSMTIDDAINLFTDINSKYGGKGKALQATKTSIENAIKEANPKIAEEFATFNKLYSRFADLRGRLAPGVRDDLIDISEKLALANAIVSKDSGLLKKTLAIFGGRKLAEKALTSPRLQFLGKQLQQAAKKGSTRSLMSAGNALEKELNSKDKEYFYETPQVISF